MLSNKPESTQKLIQLVSTLEEANRRLSMLLNRCGEDFVDSLTESRRRGLTLDDHRATHIDDVDLKSYDRIYCMSQSHAAQLRSRGVDVYIVGGGIVDPFGKSEAVYARTADQLAKEAQAIASDIATSSSKDHSPR